jgi:hypothetical protein
MPKEMHAILNDQPELGADTLVWLTRERKEWYEEDPSRFPRFKSLEHLARVSDTDAAREITGCPDDT